jgi:hypothetical protein
MRKRRRLPHNTARAIADGVNTLHSMKLDFSVLDAPVRASDVIEAEWWAPVPTQSNHQISLPRPTNQPKM